MEQQLQRVRKVTTNYRYMQGLVLVPIGLFFIGIGIWQLVGRPQPAGVDVNLWVPTLYLGGLVLSFTVSALIMVYYRRAFGQVRPSFMNEAGERLAVIGLLVGWIIAVNAQLHWQPSVNLFSLMLALMLFLIWWVTGRFRTHYVVMAGILLVLGVLPLVNPAYDVLRVSKADNPYTFIVLGLIYLIGGLGDHFLLIRSLRGIHQGTV